MPETVDGAVACDFVCFLFLFFIDFFKKLDCGNLKQYLGEGGISTIRLKK